jgi:23S rRNA (guanosine2251-2'-O)-methyltransferase
MATRGVNLNSGSGLVVFVRTRHEGANTKECIVKKPIWVVDKERNKRAAANETVWLFGIHAVRDALLNPLRVKLRFVVTKNAFDRLSDAVSIGLKDSGLEPEICEPRNFAAPIDPQSVHQGAALEVKPLDWGNIEDCCMGDGVNPPRVVLLDKVTDPHNVGAVLRSAEVFGAQAVIAMNRHAAPETGALAKTASGAMERQAYLRVRNLADAIVKLQSMGYLVLGLDGEGEQTIDQVVAGKRDRAIALVLGAEGPGLREKTKETCDALVRIDFAGEFGSLNVSNAAAVALYATRAN